MLFPYPVAATDENWLHECLVHMCCDSLNLLNAGKRVKKWPDCIPDQYRENLRSRDGLKTRLEKFQRAARKLNVDERNSIIAAIASENNIPDIYTGGAQCAKMDDLPVAIREPAKALFEFSFKLLTGLSIRDRQFEIIHKEIPAKICQFCGIEPFEAPEVSREDLDHYLAISKYPFAGVNMRNLAPMGHKCNSSHKGSIDILWNAEAGVARRCADPYGGPQVTVSLLKSVPFGGGIKGGIEMPEWHIEFTGPPEEVSTWESVFNISERYKKSVLDAEYRGWIEHFSNWWQDEYGEWTDDDGLILGLERYIKVVVQNGFADRTFLKRAVFEMLLLNCKDGMHSVRLRKWFSLLLSVEKGALTKKQAA